MTDHDEFLDELLYHADRIHTHTPGAAAPPSQTWQRVLATIQPETNHQGEPDMTTFATLSSPVVARPKPTGFILFANMAATIIVIAALAFGGWFAAMHLRPAGDNNNGIAFAPSTPIAGAATCDVEPMSVDLAMQMVKNPGGFMTYGPTASPIAFSPNDPQSADLREYGTDLQLMPGNQVPSQEQFDSGSAMVNEYLECWLYGTEAQIWNFYSPAYLQSKILAEFPVFRDETTIRARVEERASQPARDSEWMWSDIFTSQDIDNLTANPDRQLAILQNSQASAYEYVMYVGAIGTDASGKEIFRTNGTGRNLIPNDVMITGQNDISVTVTVAKLRFTDTWVIIPGYTLRELGRPDA